MQNDIKQKIYNTKYCVNLPPEYEEIIGGIVVYLKDVLYALEINENIKLLCCYSYNIKSNIIKSLNAQIKYIILDMHLFDYYLDFVYAFQKPDDYYKRYVYKYLSEIYFRKGYVFDSVCFDILYDESKQLHKTDKITLEKSVISLLFVLIHEIIHLKPEIVNKKNFVDLFNDKMKFTLSKLNLMLAGNENGLIEESFSDFTSFCLLYNVIKQLDSFNITHTELYKTCLLTIISMLFYDILEDIQIKDVDIVLKGEFNDRFMIINTFAYGLGIDQARKVSMEVMQIYIDSLKSLGGILIDLPDSVERIKSRKDIDYFIKNKITKQKDMQKNAWIRIL